MHLIYYMKYAEEIQ